MSDEDEINEMFLKIRRLKIAQDRRDPEWEELYQFQRDYEPQIKLRQRNF